MESQLPLLKNADFFCLGIFAMLLIEMVLQLFELCTQQHVVWNRDC